MRCVQSNRFAMVETDAGPFSAEYVLSLELRHFEAEYPLPGRRWCMWR